MKSTHPNMSKARGLNVLLALPISSGTYGRIFHAEDEVGHSGSNAKYARYMVGRKVQSLSTCETLPVTSEATHVAPMVTVQNCG